MAVITGQVTTINSTQSVALATGPRDVHVRANGNIYLGPGGVTAVNGFALQEGSIFTVRLLTVDEALFAIAAKKPSDEGEATRAFVISVPFV